MKKYIALLLSVIIILSGCNNNTFSAQNNQLEPNDITNNNPSNDEIKTLDESDDNGAIEKDSGHEFTDFSDPELLQLVEDDVYSNLTDVFDDDDYVIENISAVYVSQEYIDESEYNSKTNIYFGYSLDELESQFEGTRYVFTLGDDGKTVVREMETGNDDYGKVISNVAIGTGIILICATVSIVTGGAGASSVSIMFASAAKNASIYAASTGAISSIISGTIAGIQTGDLDRIKDAALVRGSDGFKWGAISGAVIGGANAFFTLQRLPSGVPSPRESELTVLGKTKNAREQVAYLNGIEVPYNTPGSTRPDVVVNNADGTITAIEVKNYDLSSSSNRNTLYNNVDRQVADRTINLPVGSTQEIVLDVRGRKYGNDVIQRVVSEIKSRLSSIYPDIPVNVMAD